MSNFDYFPLDREDIQRLAEGVTFSFDRLQNLLKNLSVVPTGTILNFAGSVAPVGFLICDGSLQDKSAYPALFAVCGALWGAATATQFVIPNLTDTVEAGAGIFAVGATYVPAHTHGGVAVGAGVTAATLTQTVVSLTPIIKT